ncbi:hypothetical protein BW897_30975 [Bacillus cereus]|uniref:Uncharacterized protein n=1 Tax=Bacillus cereus TaxID=1396 RepID=A0A1S9T8K4_BACCE|nr:hypothetical protein [Bacillus cereus]OOR06242.1 hypothetical protein BW897_30975 [Bacillus cereus]
MAYIFIETIYDINLLTLAQPLWDNISKDLLFTVVALLLSLECYKRYQSQKFLEYVSNIKYNYKHPIKMIESHKLWIENRLEALRLKLDMLLKYSIFIPIIFLFSRDLIIKYTDISLNTYSIVLIVTIIIFAVWIIKTYKQFTTTRSKLTKYDSELLWINNPDLFTRKYKEPKRKMAIEPTAKSLEQEMSEMGFEGRLSPRFLKRTKQQLEE